MLLISFVLAQSSDEQEEAGNIETLRKAMIDSNKSVMENLTAKGLGYGHSTGTIENKGAFLETIMSGKNDYKNNRIIRSRKLQ